MSIEVLDKGACIAAGTILIAGGGVTSPCNITGQGVSASAGVSSPVAVDLTLVEAVGQHEFLGLVSIERTVVASTFQPFITWIDAHTVRVTVEASGGYHFAVFRIPQPTVVTPGPLP